MRKSFILVYAGSSGHDRRIPPPGWDGYTKQLKTCVCTDAFWSQSAKLIRYLTDRIERGDSYSVTPRECIQLGMSNSSALRSMELLVSFGLLKKRVRVFDYEHDMYIDLHDQNDLSQDAEIQILYDPLVDEWRPLFVSSKEPAKKKMIKERQTGGQ